MNIEGLQDYLLILAKEGYAQDPGTKNEDGSTTIRHRSEDSIWSTTDTYWGGEPYSGCETVSQNNVPGWTLIYYGKVDPNVDNVDEIYKSLRGALANTDPTFPVRGPKEYALEGLVYSNHWHGDLLDFNGKERILKNWQEVYSASYMGGLVNVRKG